MSALLVLEKAHLAIVSMVLFLFPIKGISTGSLKIMDQETKNLDIFSLSKIVGTVLQDPDGQFIGLTVGEDIAFALENDVHAAKRNVSQVVEVSKHGRNGGLFDILTPRNFRWAEAACFTCRRDGR